MIICIKEYIPATKEEEEEEEHTCRGEGKEDRVIKKKRKKKKKKKKRRNGAKAKSAVPRYNLFNYIEFTARSACLEFSR